MWWKDVRYAVRPLRESRSFEEMSPAFTIPEYGFNVHGQLRRESWQV